MGTLHCAHCHQTITSPHQLHRPSLPEAVQIAVHSPEDLVEPETSLSAGTRTSGDPRSPFRITSSCSELPAGSLYYANRAVLEYYGWTTQHIQASEFNVLVRDIVHSP